LLHHLDACHLVGQDSSGDHICFLQHIDVSAFEQDVLDMKCSAVRLQSHQPYTIKATNIRNFKQYLDQYQHGTTTSICLFIDAPPSRIIVFLCEQSTPPRLLHSPTSPTQEVVTKLSLLLLLLHVQRVVFPFLPPRLQAMPSPRHSMNWELLHQSLPIMSYADGVPTSPSLESSLGPLTPAIPQSLARNTFIRNLGEDCAGNFEPCTALGLEG
jgi:hypothetical protein